MLCVVLTSIFLLLKYSTLNLTSLIYRGLAISIVCAALYAQSAHAAWFTVLPTETSETSLADWQPENGDSFVVDTKNNVGYLVHDNGGYTSFFVVTGLRSVVNYIGRTYFAATPERQWTVLSDERKGRSVTFGEDGTFLRLFHENERTPYGIHSHLSIKTMLERDDRYGSMGCILVSEDILDMIQETFNINGERLDVATKYGLGDALVTETTLQHVLGKNM